MHLPEWLTSSVSWPWLAIYPVDLLLRIALGVHVIMRRRPVAVSLAWLAVLLALPFLSIFIYLLVGETHLGIRRAKRHERQTKQLEEKAVHIWKHRHLDTEAIGEEFGQIARYGTAVSGMPPLRGNRLTLLPDNESMLAALERDIDGATSHCHLLYYIYLNDTAGTAIGEALLRAAKRGVACRLLVDGVGSRAFLKSDLHTRLTAGGVQVVEALPVNLFRRPFARVDLRNHRKIAVIDGRVAYCGSQNITDTHFRSHKWRKTGQWIDATVRVDGPAAQALAVTFLRDWQLDSDEDMSDVAGFLPEPLPHEDHECVVQVVPSGPGPTPEAIHQAVLTLIYSAREELIMTTPYFVPDQATLEALRAAAARGVDVTLVMPRVSDSPLVAAASRSHYLDLLETGVRIHHYEGGLLHAKAMTIDRKVGLIGSTNFDQRSFFLNFEVTLFIYDDNFASVLRFMQMGYLNNAEEVELHEWRRRGWLESLRDNAAQLLGPLL